MIKRPLAIYNGIIKELNINDSLFDSLISTDPFEIVLDSMGNTTNTFTLTKVAYKVLVFLDGILQKDFTQPNNTNILTLGFIPTPSENIIAIAISNSILQSGLLCILNTLTNGSTYTLTNTADNIMVFIDGILQYDFNHTINSNSLILNFTPEQNKRIVAYTSINDSKLKSHTIFNYNEELNVSIGVVKWFPPSQVYLTDATCFVSDAPVGHDISISILKNNIEISTLTISDGEFNSNKVTLSELLLQTDYLTININSVGSITNGSFLNLRITYTY